MALPAPVLRLATAQHLLVNRRQLLDLGVSSSAIGRLVAAGIFDPVHAGVFALAGAPVTFELECAAASLSGPLVAVSGPSAGRLLGLRRMGEARPVHVMVPNGARSRLADAVVHRSWFLDEDDVVRRPDGIVTLSAPRLLFDLAARLSPFAVRSVIEQMVDLGHCSIDDAHAVLDRVRQRGRAGSVRLEEVLAQRAPGPAVMSELELRFEMAVHDAGLPAPKRQAQLAVPGLGLVHPDFWWPVPRVAVEIDHGHWHSDPPSVAYDKRRDRKLAVAGVRVMRITDADVNTRLVEVVVDLGRLLRQAS